GRGLRARRREGGRDERARLSVETLEARDQCVRQLDRRELAGRDELRELGDREVVQLRGHGALPLRAESSGAEYSVDAPAGDGYPWAAMCAPQAVAGLPLRRPMRVPWRSGRRTGSGFTTRTPGATRRRSCSCTARAATT